MPRIRKGYAEGRWGQIHYKECGPVGDHEGRPLLLLHQSPTDSVQFARAMRPLAVRGIRAIAIDLPGFGGSDTPPAPPSVADYAHIVPAVLDHLGIAKASILGHHTGAVIATEAALHAANSADPANPATSLRARSDLNMGPPLVDRRSGGYPYGRMAASAEMASSTTRCASIA